MRFLPLLSFLLFVISCSDNAFIPIDTVAPRDYSSNATLNSEDAAAEVTGYLGKWSGVLSSVDPDAPQNIRVSDNGTNFSVSLDFGNGVIHTARVKNGYAVLPLTGTSWKNAIEECPPTASLFVTLKLKLMESAEDRLSIENTLKTEPETHKDLFSLKVR